MTILKSLVIFSKYANDDVALLSNPVVPVGQKSQFFKMEMYVLDLTLHLERI